MKNPKEWAFDLWEKASKSWIDRESDYYRNHLVHPALENEVEHISIKEGIFIDLGCGDGKETIFFKKILKNNGCTGTFYGFDTNKHFIKLAQRKIKRNAIIFEYGQLVDLINKHNLVGKADLITSLFVLQDTPEIEELTKIVYDALKSGGMFLIVIVNPQFGKTLLNKGKIKVNHQLKDFGYKYDFAGEYPIVRKDRNPFYVPYFHRDLSYYVRLFEQYFCIELIKYLKPSKEMLYLAKKERISPFYGHKYNVYWPEISQITSSLIFRLVKIR